MRGSDEDRSPIGNRVVDPVGIGHSFALRAEIVIVDRCWLAAPHPTGILEVADQFLFLGINADDRQATVQETLFVPGNATKLQVSMLGRNRDRFGVCVQGIVELTEQSSHGVGTDGNSQSA